MMNIGIKGFLSWAVLDKNNKIKYYNKIKIPNLITTYGLNSVGVRSFAENFTFLKLGTGNTEAQLSDISLENEIATTSNHLNGLCGYFTNANAVNLYRTFQSAPFASSQTVREVGFTHSENGNLFSRIITEDIQVAANDNVVVRYDFVIFFSPETPVIYNTPSFLSYEVGSFGFQSPGLVGINSDGNTIFTDSSNGSNEPSITSQRFFSESSLGFAPLFSVNDRSGSTNIIDKVFLENYSNNSFYREKIVSANFSTPTIIRSVGVGTPSDHGSLFLFDNDVTVSGDIAFCFRYQWGEFNAQFKTLSYWRDPEENDLFFKNPILNYFELNL